MARRFEEKRLIIASHNPGKVREIEELLSAWSIGVVSAAELNLPEPEETGDSFAANAKLKSDAAAFAAKLPALADDSGLTVDALGGAPGIYSARWGGPEKDFDAAMGRVNEEIGDNPDRNAQFVCALALTWPDGSGPDQIVDDGGDATLLIHKGVELEAGDETWVNSPAESDEEQVIKNLLKKVRRERPNHWTPMAKSIVGVSEETTTGVHRLLQMEERGELLPRWKWPLGEEVHAARALNRAVASASPRVGIVSTAELSHRVVQVAERDQVGELRLGQDLLGEGIALGD